MAPTSSPYERRLKKTTIIGKLADFVSLLTPRLRRKVPEQVRRIGVIVQWGIGDAVLLLPLLRGLREAYPRATIELVGKPWLSELFAGEACCDRVHLLVPPWVAYEKKYAPSRDVWIAYVKQIRLLRTQTFDWLISTRFDPREALQLRLLRACQTFGFRSAGGRHWIARDFGLDRPAHDAIHRSAVSMAMLRAIVKDAPLQQVSFRQDPAGRSAALQRLKAGGYRSGAILAVHAGAGHPIRRWREPHFETVIRSLDAQPGMIVFILADDVGGSRDPRTSAVQVPHIFWRSNLAELKPVLSVCDVFLGPDSGIMHMAAAAGCRVVAPFGPGESRWFSPSGKHHEIVMVEPMPCRPCFDACIYSSPICIDQIEDRRLIAAVDKRLRDSVHAPRIDGVSKQ
jgi:ADP-heptose:LPS heptosyltransferase